MKDFYASYGYQKEQTCHEDNEIINTTVLALVNKFKTVVQTAPRSTPAAGGIKRDNDEAENWLISKRMKSTSSEEKTNAVTTSNIFSDFACDGASGYELDEWMERPISLAVGRPQPGPLHSAEVNAKREDIPVQWHAPKQHTFNMFDRDVKNSYPVSNSTGNNGWDNGNAVLQEPSSLKVNSFGRPNNAANNIKPEPVRCVSTETIPKPSVTKTLVWARGTVPGSDDKKDIENVPRELTEEQKR